jgi:hypothetical protein
MLVLVVMSLVLIVSKFRDIFFRTSNLELLCDTKR